MEPTPSGTVHGGAGYIRNPDAASRSSGILVTEAIKMFEMGGFRKEEAQRRAEFFTNLFSDKTLKITGRVIEEERK